MEVISSWKAIQPYLKSLQELDSHCFGLSYWPVDILKRLFANQQLTIILAFKDSQLAGFIAYTAVFPEVELLKIGVTDKFRRQSIATQLILKMLQELNMQRANCKISLDVRADNLPALAFYDTLNFKKVGTRKNYYSNPTADAILLDLAL